MYTIVRVLLILFAYLKLSNSCSCLKSHPQQSFCNSDFAILAVPEKLIDDGGFTVQYVINIKDTFKMTHEAKTSLINNLITTASDSATCGVRLELNKQYFLSGTVDDGIAKIFLCGWNTLWENVSKNQEKGLRSEYEKGCSCEIKPSFDCEKCTASDEKSVCMLDHFAMERPCYDDFSSCISTDGQCHWTKDEKFVECTNSPLDLQKIDNTTT